MFLLFCLSAEERIGPTGDPKYRNFNAGYYSVTVAGAQGSQACLNGEVVNHTQGGHGAIISGLLRLNRTSEFEIFVGKSHSINCSYNPDDAIDGLSKYSGFSGHNTCNNYTFGGIGGEYTRIRYKYPLTAVAEVSLVIITAGGGSGATINTNGASAGAINSSFKINQYGEEEICNDDCITILPERGQSNSDDCNLIPGSGSGGGTESFNGIRGNATNESSIYLSAGTGGSSYYDELFFVGTPNFFVGANNSAFGDGYIDIEQIIDCSEEYDKCQNCSNGYLSIQDKTCYMDCRDTSFKSYPDELNKICRECPANCISCTNGSFCTNCDDGYDSSAGKCILPERTQTETPSLSSDTSKLLNLEPELQIKNDETIPIGLIIGVVVGALALIIAIVCVVIFCRRRSKNSDDSITNEDMHDTEMIAGAGMMSTLENPIFTTTTFYGDNTEDIFANEFEEEAIEGHFIRHSQ